MILVILVYSTLMMRASSGASAGVMRASLAASVIYSMKYNIDCRTNLVEYLVLVGHESNICGSTTSIIGMSNHC